MIILLELEKNGHQYLIVTEKAPDETNLWLLHFMQVAESRRKNNQKSEKKTTEIASVNYPHADTGLTRIHGFIYDATYLTLP